MGFASKFVKEKPIFTSLILTTKDDLTEDSKLGQEEWISQLKHKIEADHSDVSAQSVRVLKKLKYELDIQRVYEKSARFMDELYLNTSNNFQSETSDYPLYEFFERCSKIIDKKYSKYYPYANGISDIKTLGYEKRFRLNDKEISCKLGDAGYPESQFKYIKCMAFMKYCIEPGNDRLFAISSPKLRLMNKSIVALCEDMKKIVRNVGNIQDNYEKITRFFKFCSMLQRSTEMNILSLFAKAYSHVCTEVCEDLRNIGGCEIMLKRAQRYSDKLESIEHEFKIKLEFDITKVHNKSILYYENVDLISQLFEDLIMGYIEADRDMIQRQITSYEKLEWPFQPIELAFKNAIVRKIMQVPIPHANRLKDWVSYIDKLLKLNNIFAFLKVPSIRLEKQFGLLLQEKWNKISDKDLTGHLAHYFDYKLKNLPRYKDRNKLENELKFLTSCIKYHISNFSLSERVKFQRRYIAMYVQRMISTLFEADFNIYINISDCENEVIDAMVKYLDIKEISEIQDNFMKSYDYFKQYNTLTGSFIIGLPKEYGVEDTEKMALPLHMGLELKEYKRWIRDKLRINKKFKLELNNWMSRVEIDYTTDTGGTARIDCNLYQGMILRLFDEERDEELAADAISEKLNIIDGNVTLKNLRMLSDEKAPILKETGGKWSINKEFAITEKQKTNGIYIR